MRVDQSSMLRTNLSFKEQRATTCVLSSRKTVTLVSNRHYADPWCSVRQRGLNILRISQQLDGSRWISTELDGARRISTDLDVSRCISTDIDGSRRISTDLDGARRISMDLDGPQRTSMDLDESRCNFYVYDELVFLFSTTSSYLDEDQSKSTSSSNFD